MSAYVLVHGAWHGGWCWDRVVPLLNREGHRVEAPDLPGHGKDKTPIQEVSLQYYTDSICKILDAQSEPVILIGHSMGGVVITETAEHRPEKIRTLVYLTAYLLRNGESVAQASQRDTESLLPPNLVFPRILVIVLSRMRPLERLFTAIALMRMWPVRYRFWYLNPHHLF